MTARDLAEISLGNLWRMKLRSALTISGVLIAIAAFVAMLSFGAGMQERVSEQFDDLGLLHTMHVYPGDEKPATDSLPTIPLDAAAITMLAAIPGVRLAYPFDRFSVTVDFRDTTFRTTAQALPVAAVQTKLFSQVVAGENFASDTAGTAIITRRLLRDLGIDEPDSVIGDTLVIAVKVVSLDSALTRLVFYGNLDSLKRKIKEIDLDSLRHGDYRRRLFNRELGDGIGRFLDGFLNARTTVSDTLVIGSVIKRTRRRARSRPLIVPIATGRRLSAAGFSGGAPDLMAALAAGEFMSGGAGGDKTFSQATIDLDPGSPYAPIRDSVEALGFETFSYAEEFEEIRQIFMYFNMALGMIGLIALVTSSLGIINTMLMSIVERRREIGVIKSLGADEREIRLLFLFESGMIGMIGAVGGIIVGWLISRVGSFIAQTYMEREGVPPIDLFTVPPWLIIAALLIGLVVSLAAGYYPAARAARVDPVAALRNE